MLQGLQYHGCCRKQTCLHSQITNPQVESLSIQLCWVEPFLQMLE